MHLRVLFVFDFFLLSLLTLVSLTKGQEVWSNTNNANGRTRLDPGMGFATGYQPSGSVSYNLGHAMPDLNYRESSSYGLPLGTDFSLPFNKPGGYASSSKFSDETSSLIPATGTNADKRGIEQPVDLSYKFYDWVTKFGSSSNSRNGFNMQQAGGTIANSGLGNVPINTQNSGFSNGNVDMTTFPEGTVPVNNQNVFNSGSWNNRAMKTFASGIPESEQNAGLNKGPLSNTEANKVSVGSVASPGYVGSENSPKVMNDGIFPSNGRNDQVFALGLPFNSAEITPENPQFDETATPYRPTPLNTSDEEIYKILSESEKTTEVQGRKKAPKKKKPGNGRRSRSKNRSKAKNSRPKISSGSDVQDGQDITNENIPTPGPETSPVPVKKDLPSFLASALNKFDTPSTVHYISSAASLLVSDDEFDLASLPAVILALTMQIRSAFPGLSNCELLNQVFLQLIIALGHILKQSKVGDVSFDSVADTAELVMKAF